MGLQLPSRAWIEQAVESLIGLLDVIDGDPDLEEEPDLEDGSDREAADEREPDDGL